jgi:hypothetical protein
MSACGSSHNSSGSNIEGLGILVVVVGKGKGKVLPRTGHEGPEGE